MKLLGPQQRALDSNVYGIQFINSIDDAKCQTHTNKQTQHTKTQIQTINY